MVGYIYKITNKLNDKTYIGKTTKTVQERWKEHLRDCRKERCENRPLYRAIKKYGIDAFTVETLEEVDLENLSEREFYWILYFNTYSNGYNATTGGDGKILYDYNIIIQLLREGRKYHEIADMVGCCYDTVRSVVKKCNIDYCSRANKYIHIEQHDLEGHYIQSFNSDYEAAYWLLENKYTSNARCSGIIAHIEEVARGERKTAYGFLWKKSDSCE